MSPIVQSDGTPERDGLPLQLVPPAGLANWVVLLALGTVAALIVATAIAVAIRGGNDEAKPATTGSPATAPAPSNRSGGGTPPRCVDLAAHHLTAPDDRNVRISGPAQPIDYPGHLEGTFDSLGETDVLWTVVYALDAGRYWPAEKEAAVDWTARVWRTVEGSFFLGGPDQHGVEFDALIALVERGSPAHSALLTLFDGEATFEGWSTPQLPEGMTLHDCARLVRI